MVNTSLIQQLFGNSPIKPLQKHIKLAHKCAKQLRPYFVAVLAQDWEKAQHVADKIYDLEHRADDVKHDIRSHLPKSLFLPVSRSDLLELLGLQDMIANIAKDITGLILGRKAVLPASLGELLCEYVESSVVAVDIVHDVVNELDELVDSGFSGREIEIIEVKLKNLDQAEHHTDVLQVAIRAKLFEIEKTLDPVDVMFLYRIIEWIGYIADHAQHVGDRMLYMIAR